MAVEPPLTDASPAHPGDDKATATSSVAGTERPGSSKTLMRSIFKLAAGRGAVIALGLVLAPVLSRLYDPKDFGTLALLTMIVGVLEGFTSLAYIGAMPLAESAAKRRDLFVLSSVIAVVGTLILSIAVLFGAELFADVFGVPDLAVYGFVIPLLFLALAMRVSLNMALSCQKKYGRVSLRNVIVSLGTRGTQIVAGLAGWAWSPAGLILGTVVGWSAGAMAFSIPSVRSMFRRSTEPLRLADLKSVAVEYRRFPGIELWTGTLNKVTLWLPVLVMGLLFSEVVVGLYAFARTLVCLPTQLFTFSSSQVYYVEAAESVTRGDSVARTTSDLLRLLILLTAFPFTVVLILGPLLFEVVFGPPWREAGVYAMILVPWVASGAIVTPISRIFMAKNRLGEQFAYNVVSLIVRLAALLIGGWYFGPRVGLACCSLGTLIILMHAFGRALKLAEVSRRQAAGTLLRHYGEAVLFFVPCGVLYWACQMEIGALVALAVVSIAYATMIYLRYPEISAVLRRVLPSADRAG